MSILGLALPAIIGGTQIATGARANKLNRKATRDINTSQLSYGWDMYNQQRKDALIDRDYNAPAQIMQRYKEAGLNPNLIYGQGSDGTSVRSSSPGSSNLEVPKTDPNAINQGLDTLGNAFAQFVDIQNTQAKTDNLREQRELIAAEVNAANAGTKYAGARTETEIYNLEYAKGQRRTRQQQEQATLDKTLADIVYTIDSNDRSNLSNTANIAKTVQDIAQSKLQMAHERLQMENTKENRNKILAEINHLKALVKLSNNETAIKKIHQDMYNDGMTPSDPGYWRLLVETANGITTGIKKLIK